MVTEAGKELLRNTINTAKFHNRILEENEMWKQWELECGLTMMVSDDDIIKRIKKNHHQCSKHRKRDKSRSRERSRSRDSSRSRYGVAKIKHGAGSSNDRWDHSGFAELYPDADVPKKYPSTSSVDRNRRKKKKSHRRSNSSDKEIWEEFKRPAQMWNKENTIRLIQLLRDAPALWNINYPAYKDQHVKLRETKRIASKFRVDENEIMMQIVFLMDKFQEKYKKIKLEISKGACVECLENEWFAYKHMTFLINNERRSKIMKNNISGDEDSQWVDSSDSYSDSEHETSQPSENESSSYNKGKLQAEKSDRHGKKANYARSNLPYLQAYKAQKDSFSVYGEIVAHRMREAKKSSKAIARAEREIDTILRQFETGYFDPPEETFK